MSGDPVPSRACVIAGAQMLKALGHAGFSAFLLELDVHDTEASNGPGLMARATSLAAYALKNPHLRTPEGLPLQVAIVGRARELWDRGVMYNIGEKERDDFAAAFQKGDEGLSVSRAAEAGLSWWDKTASSTGVTSVTGGSTEKRLNRRVFIVHGHDEAAREIVARFLSTLAFEVIILHERANQGRTIIEKFEANSDVGFAVVLLTPDDEGGKRGAAVHARARQNVILEWGYFVGRLGRDKVCALKKGELELPSDALGIVWEALDEFGGWKTKLAKELEAARYSIDWSKVR